MDYKAINKKTYTSISENWETKRRYAWKPVVEFLNNIKEKDARILDLGCGAGRHLELAKELGFIDLTGSDFAQQLLMLVEAKGFKTKLSDMENLQFEDNSFDIILNIAALHHLLEQNEQLRALQEMKRVLDDKGLILLSVWMPSLEFMNNMIAKGKFTFLDKKRAKITYTAERKVFDRYYYFFEEQELIGLCKQAGFNVIAKQYDKDNLYIVLKK